jgi:flagellar motility protein MotE (MotC chaperone)
MASRVRVLPAVIAVSIGALAFKGVDIAQAVAENAQTEEAPAEEPHEAAPEEGQPEEAPPAAAAAGAKCEPAINYSAETGISEQEIQVLRSLSERRQVLDQRENELVTREQLAAAAEAKLNDQIAELKKLEGEVNTVLASIDAKRDERMASLVKTYEAMKPKDAARIFDGMEDGTLLDLAKSMKPATLAAVMASMDSKRAEQLTRMLAKLADPVSTQKGPAGKT